MTRKLHVVVVAPWLPEQPPRHAGGAAVARHVAALAAVHDVTLIAPAVDATPLPLMAGVAVNAIRWSPAKGRLARGVNYLRWLRAGVGWHPRADDAVLSSLEHCDWNSSPRSVDLVEAQYLESLPIAHLLAERFEAPLVLWSHDVVTVELERQRRAAKSARLRLEAAVRLPGARRVQCRLLPECSGVVVFNPDDAAVLKQQGVRGPVRVMRPAIEAGDGEPARDTGPVALAVAAFGRPANREGIHWLLEKVWPAVRVEVPDAVLRLVGSDAPSVQQPGVQTVGFVERLGDEYRRARVVVAPLFIGAGLKFKVPQAFSWGLPVVATKIAAEGLTPPLGVGFAAVTDDPREYADAIVMMLSDSSAARRVGRSGASWWTRAAQDFSSEADVASWYAELSVAG